jgi:molecular chaperone GrpE
MNPEHNSKLNPLNKIDLNESGSLDKFLKELEAKEKDLDISAEMVVEVEAFEIEQDEIEQLIQTYQTNQPLPQQPAPNTFTNPTPSQVSFSDLEAEVSKLRQEVAKTSAEKSEIQETFRRRQTDFENFRNRTERERAEIFRSVIGNLAVKILPVVDNFNRALDSSEKSGVAKSQDFQNFLDGISMINHQLNEVLGEMGIQPIISLGRPFDPHYHEAVATVPTDRVPPNTVIEELIRGYHIDNKVIRPSMVKVSSSTNSDQDLDSLEID